MSSLIPNLFTFMIVALVFVCLMITLVYGAVSLASYSGIYLRRKKKRTRMKLHVGKCIDGPMRGRGHFADTDLVIVLSEENGSGQFHEYRWSAAVLREGEIHSNVWVYVRTVLADGSRVPTEAVHNTPAFKLAKETLECMQIQNLAPRTA